MPLAPGQILNNRYRIVMLLGQGGMGAVYKAWDLHLSRPRALKENLEISPEAQRQFKREAQILCDLSHHNLPKVIDYFITGQGQYLVMEFVEGEDLREKLQHAGKLLSETQVLDWITQVCTALDYLHSQNPPVIHRDIKPANIKVTPQGKAILVDFGIAKVFDPNLSTTVGAKAITPGYSPLEQYGSGQHTGPAADIYALGATLYTLLSRQTPPPAPDRNLGAALASLRMLNPAVTPGVEAAVMKAMAMQPQDRFGSAAEFASALLPMPPPTPVRQPSARGPRPSAYWLAGGLVALILGVGYLLIGNLIKPPPPPTTTPTIATPTFTLTPTVTPSPSPTTTLTPTYTSTPTLTVHPVLSHAPPATADPGAIWTRPVDGMVMVYISAGNFLMGSSDSDMDAVANEKLQHTVYLDAYWIDQTEVTNAQYALCVAVGKCQSPQQPSDSNSTSLSNYFGDSQYDDYPVINSTWDEAVAYCDWAGGRLPTEAEWEKAARGADGHIYPWGDQVPTCQLANYIDCVGDTSAVGSYPAGASPYGLLDMAGNVWEWVQDWDNNTYYTNSPAANPPGPPSGQQRVLRGGAWYDARDHIRSAYRISDGPGNRYKGFGFRCGMSPGT